MQTWGENYWETYAPVVNWLSVRVLLIISILHNLDTRSMDFILAFPQAKLDVDVYMDLPFGFESLREQQFPNAATRAVYRVTCRKLLG